MHEFGQQVRKRRTKQDALDDQRAKLLDEIENYARSCIRMNNQQPNRAPIDVVEAILGKIGRMRKKA